MCPCRLFEVCVLLFLVALCLTQLVRFLLSHGTVQALCRTHPWSFVPVCRFSPSFAVSLLGVSFCSDRRIYLALSLRPLLASIFLSSLRVSSAAFSPAASCSFPCPPSLHSPSPSLSPLVLFPVCFFFSLVVSCCFPRLVSVSSAFLFSRASRLPSVTALHGRRACSFVTHLGGGKRMRQTLPLPLMTPCFLSETCLSHSQLANLAGTTTQDKCPVAVVPRTPVRHADLSGFSFFLFFWSLPSSSAHPKTGKEPPSNTSHLASCVSFPQGGILFAIGLAGGTVASFRSAETTMPSSSASAAPQVFLFSAHFFAASIFLPVLPFCGSFFWRDPLFVLFILSLSAVR